MSAPSSELSKNSIVADRHERDRSYWLARQWAYHSFLPRSAIEGQTRIALNTHSEVGAGQVYPTMPDLAVQQLLSGVQLEPGNLFSYAGRRIKIRPVARQMLIVMCAAAGCSVPIATLSRQLWKRGGPPSHNTLRTTIFRANLAFRGTGCPLHLSVRGAELVLQSTSGN
jgi:hypothetical protein